MPVYVNIYISHVYVIYTYVHAHITSLTIHIISVVCTWYWRVIIKHSDVVNSNTCYVIRKISF